MPSPSARTTLVRSYFGGLRVTTGVRGLAPFARFIFRAAFACQQVQLLLRTLEVPPHYSPVFYWPYCLVDFRSAIFDYPAISSLHVPWLASFGDRRLLQCIA